MGQVRAKFSVVEKKETPASEGNGFAIMLAPVTGGSDENKQFYKWTPGGSIYLATINPAAAEQFKVGKSYYVDFTEAE